jgi:hypothetical protein
VIAAPSAHRPMITQGDVEASATTPGERKMPWPMTLPITAASPKTRPSTRKR